MHAVGQALTREVLNHSLEVVELRGERGPAVDDQEHVAERVRRCRAPGVVAHLSVVGHRSDTQLLECLLTLPQNSFHLGDHPHHPIGFSAGGDTTDVGQVLDVHEAAAAHVDAVDLQLAGGVRRGRGKDQRLQERRLTRLRGATDGDVARRGRDINSPHFLTVPARFVHDAQPDAKRPALVVAGDQLVHGRGIGQRR